MVNDAARLEAPSLRVFDACYGYLMKYNLPAPEAGAVLATAQEPSTPTGLKKQAPTPKRSRPPARAKAAEPRTSLHDHSPKGGNRASESGSRRRRPRSRSRGKKSAHAEVALDKKHPRYPHRLLARR